MMNTHSQSALGAVAQARTARPSVRHNDGLTIENTLVFVFLFAVCLRMTHFHSLIGGFMFPVTLVIEYATYAYFAYKSAARWHYKTVFWFLLYVAFLLYQVYNFQWNTGIKANINAILPYGSVLMVIVFLQTDLSFRKIQQILLGIAVGYLLIYTLFYPFILAAVDTDSSLYRPASGGREARLAVAGGLASFPLIVGLFSIRRSPVISTFLIGLSGYAILMAENRSFAGALLVGLMSAFVGAFAPELRRTANLGLAAIFLVLASLLLVGLFGIPWNPYEALAGDTSGYARYLQYWDGVRTFRDNYIFGIGIPASTPDLQYYVNPARPFFPSDLGTFGIAYQFGLPFAIAFIAISVVFILRPVELPGAGRAFPLFYTVQLQAFLGFFAASLLASTATIFAALTVAGWFKYKQAL